MINERGRVRGNDDRPNPYKIHLKREKRKERGRGDRERDADIARG